MPKSGGGSVNIQGNLHVAGYLGDGDNAKKKRKLKKEQPRTLYINRPVSNADKIVDWAKKQGFKTTIQPDDMHVTVAFSKKPLFWSAVGHEETKVIIDGGSRSLERLGDGGCVVLRFDSETLEHRWAEVIDCGASWDWPSYKPHISLSWDAADLDISKIKPYMGLIEFGPEEFVEVEEDWKDSIVEKCLGSLYMEKVNLFVRDNVPQKQTKAEVKYQDEWNGTQRCGRCSHFKGSPAALTENCDTVEGKVSSEGWCVLFNPRASTLSQQHTVNPVDTSISSFGKNSWQERMMQKVGARHSKDDRDSIQAVHDHSVKLGARCDGHDAFNDMKTEKRAIDAKILKVDESLGLVMGWAIISKINGEDYYDLNVDPSGERVPEHIPEAAMLKASADFMLNSRAGNEMHGGSDKGTYVFAFPMTTDIAKAMGMQTPVTGLMVAYKPPPEIFAKFASGEYKGFSIEGKRIDIESVEEVA